MTSWETWAATLPQHQALGRYTAARIGGQADFLYVAHAETPDEDIASVFVAACQAGIPVRVIGGGANILVSDAGVRGLVIVNRAAGITDEGNTRLVRAGTGLLALARDCAHAGLTGFEWAIGVPGTVGGAVVNNAGAHGGDMAANTVQAAVVQADGHTAWLTKAALDFSYRTSALKHATDPFLIQQVRMTFASDEPAAIQTRMAGYSAQRKRTQPNGASLGSVFRNPPDDYAGRLIEACGLKGLRVGSAEVSSLHANFFLSDGTTTARDYRTLIEQVQAAVQREFGIRLEPEIQFVGDWHV